MSRWRIKRRQPYTVAGMRRLRCIRCGQKAVHQWQICSDGNNHRPICLDCDIALNCMVLVWMRHPSAKRLAAEYERRMRARTWTSVG